MKASWVVIGVWALAAVACGGAVDADGDGVGGSGANSGSGGSGNGGGGAGGRVPFGGSGGSILDGGKDAHSDGAFPDGWVDPGCPDAEAPPPQFLCDPLGPNTCPFGQGCYPFVQYPTGPCDFEEYGAFCAEAGSAGQGEPCFGGPASCAPGLDCWLTGQGTECLQLCDTVGANTCPDGLLCLTTDVEGIGACF